MLYLVTLQNMEDLLIWWRLDFSWGVSSDQMKCLAFDIKDRSHSEWAEDKERNEDSSDVCPVSLADHGGKRASTELIFGDSKWVCGWSFWRKFYNHTAGFCNKLNFFCLFVVVLTRLVWLLSTTSKIIRKAKVKFCFPSFLYIVSYTTVFCNCNRGKGWNIYFYHVMQNNWAERSSPWK